MTNSVFQRLEDACHIFYQMKYVAVGRIGVSFRYLQELVQELVDRSNRITAPIQNAEIELYTSTGPVQVYLEQALHSEDHFFMTGSADHGRAEALGVFVGDDEVAIDVGDPVLVIKDPRFFLVRALTGGFPMRETSPPSDPNWSVPTITEIAKSWTQVVVFWDTDRFRYGRKFIPDQTLEKVVESLGFAPFDLVYYPGSDNQVAVEACKRSIIRYGGIIKKTENPQEITPLLLDNFVHGTFITWAGVGDHARLGVRVDKPKRFLEFAKDRESKANW